MTPQDEEHLLIDQLISTRQSLARAEMEYLNAKSLRDRMQRQTDEVEQAILDYCIANGIIQFNTENHSISMSSRESIDVLDIDAVPEEYIRIKREPDKVKIMKNTRAEDCNWYTKKTTNFITLRSKI